jgi:tRNA(fMet)-specific endonuclease VapC
MLRFLFDTDHLTLMEFNTAPVVQRLALCLPDEVGVSAVSVEEALRGRLAGLARPLTGVQRVRRYELLVQTVQLLFRFPIVEFDAASESHFQQLRALRLRVRVPDLKIAAVALANQVTLLTRNKRDFGQVPGILLDDWSV